MPTQKSTEFRWANSGWSRKLVVMSLALRTPGAGAAAHTFYFLNATFHEQIFGFEIDIWIFTLSWTSNIQNLNIMFLKPLVNGTTIHFLVNLHH